MIFRTVLVFALLLFTLPQIAAAADRSVAKAVAQKTRLVMTWVPPYNATEAQSPDAAPSSQKQLNRMYGEAGPKNSLTHLGLQFWVPKTRTVNGKEVTRVGQVSRADYGTISDATIAQFVRWGNRNKVKTLLTIYNGENGWDWELARKAFDPANMNGFVNALIAEMEAYDLDGVDVDIEGSGITPTQDDKRNYLAFIRKLSEKLRTRGKQLTVDTFPFKWNAPHWDWWSQLFPHVDGITSMGYDDLGRDPPTEAEWRAYAAQKAKAGANAHKLMIGMPSYLESWQGSTAVSQVQWFLSAEAGDVGIGIWDAQNQAEAWNTEAVWRKIKKVRQDEIAPRARP